MLIRTTVDPETVATATRSVLQGSPGVKVSSIGDAVHTIGSSLTSVELSGLTKLELAFALLMVGAAAGLTLALDWPSASHLRHSDGDRCGPSQLGVFIWSEALIVLLAGASIGTAFGIVIAFILVKLLTGIFDPPPETLVVPWLYLFIASVAGTAAVIAAATAAQIVSGREIAETIRRER